MERILSAKQREGGAGIPACQTEADKNVCATLERQLDELVYALYGLTPGEIKLVEDATT